MQKYVGCKIIKAEKMDECTFLEKFKGEDVSNRETRPGYHVKYPDGYDSWSPAEVFENAYRLLTNAEFHSLVDEEPESEKMYGVINNDGVESPI